jgi:uncharacterized membrane protein
MSQQSSVVGVYEKLDAAEAAVKKLDEGKFPIQQISVVAKDIQDEKKVHGYVTACDVSKSGAKTGAWMGGLFGALVGAAFIWVPGVGLAVVAGSLSAALLGGVEGALAGSAMGGILSGLAAWGISKQHILKYEESVKAGSYLLVAHGAPEEVALAQSLLQGTGAAEVNVHSATA